MPKVYIVGRDEAVSQMFLRMGWTLASGVDETIDLIQFTGGADVDPSYYKQERHAATRSDPRRDAYEAAVYNEWKTLVPMAGICRGGQFLNVMNGGALYQHVTNHALQGTHEAFCRISEKSLQVTSTHHQMMIPSSGGKVLLTAQLADSKQTASHNYNGWNEEDVEAVYYPATLSLCYQPHPEYVSINHECQVKYFDYLEKFIL